MKKIWTIPLLLMLLVGCAGTSKEKFETVYYPPLPQSPRIQFLTSFTTEADLGAKQDAFEEFLLGKSTGTKRILRPYGIATVEGKIYISDRSLRRVLIVDLVKKDISIMPGMIQGALKEPAGIFITPSGDKYVADFGRKQIVVYNANDEYVKAYGSEGQFSKPLDVVVYENRMYVTDFDAHTIHVVDLETGETIDTFGSSGAAEGEMHRPSHLTLDKGGNLYVNDSFNFRVQKFSPDGEFEKKFGYQGDTLGGFARPKGVAIDNDGHLYVVDTAFENVQIFDHDSGYLLLYFGGYGNDPGFMYLPNSIHIDYENVKYFQQYVDKNFKVEYLITLETCWDSIKLMFTVLVNGWVKPFQIFRDKTINQIESVKVK
jgi:DNA-binding beta-propeller fold protein YncE